MLLEELVVASTAVDELLELEKDESLEVSLLAVELEELLLLSAKAFVDELLDETLTAVELDVSLFMVLDEDETGSANGQ